MLTNLFHVSFVGFGLVKVIRSEDPNYSAGQYVVGMIREFHDWIPWQAFVDVSVAWEAYTVQPWDGKQISDAKTLPAFTVDVDAMSMVKVAKHPTIPWSTFMGALGGSGQTAYMGLKEHADMKEVYIPTSFWQVVFLHWISNHLSTGWNHICINGSRISWNVRLLFSVNSTGRTDFSCTKNLGWSFSWLN